MKKANANVRQIADVAHGAVDRAADAAKPAVDWLGAKADALLAAPSSLAEGGRKVVANHPWKAVGAAVAIGILMSRILR